MLFGRQTDCTLPKKKVEETIPLLSSETIPFFLSVKMIDLDSSPQYSPAPHAIAKFVLK